MRHAIVFAFLFLVQETVADESNETTIADSTVAGMTCLKTSNGSFFRGRDLRPSNPFNPWTLEVVDRCDSDKRWYIEYYGMNVALKPEWMAFEFLIANDDGSVDLKTWPELEERLWTPTKNEDDSWSFRSAMIGRWLAVVENGNISTTNDTTDLTKNFWLESRGEWAFYSHQASYPRGDTGAAVGEHCIKTAYDNYLRKSDDSDGVNLAPKCGECDRWIIELDVRLPKCESKAYLSAHRDGSVKIRHTFGFGNDLWRAFKNEDGSWSFQSSHGSWLRARSDGSVGLEMKPRPATRFWLQTKDATSTAVPLGANESALLTNSTAFADTLAPQALHLIESETNKDGLNFPIEAIFVPILIALLVVVGAITHKRRMRKRASAHNQRRMETERKLLE